MHVCTRAHAREDEHTHTCTHLCNAFNPAVSGYSKFSEEQGETKMMMIARTSSSPFFFPSFSSSSAVAVAVKTPDKIYADRQVMCDV